MATVVLQTFGAAIGGAIGGPFGAVLGRAAGAAAGYAIDQSLLSKDQVIQGPRLESTRILSSDLGAPIPRVYGRNRISGQVIWATRFEEVASSTQAGSGKGSGNSTSTTSFSYFGNFAIALCEGEVSALRRVWADNQEIDLTEVEYRFYTGSDDQLPDPMIEAKQGEGNTPAYRGTCYIVFEGFPLGDYGNRIPQFNFEIIRAVGKLEQEIRSISVIPGSTEFGYDTELVSNGGGAETYQAHNRNMLIAETDWIASIDELQALCPNLQSVSLIVSWFGTDLRAGECKISPGVTTRVGSLWRVGGLRRHEAHLVSQIDGRAAFGGTPNDASLLRAIADLKARGLKVVLYPFIMMDIPADNTLPSLSGSGTQNAYPWRGEISCFPAPSTDNSTDKTNAARLQLEKFATEYRKLIHHYANLCVEADGVDGFLIGSELRSLTRVRDGSGRFPFVETLIELAGECKTIMGSETKILYAADWSEYFGYQPQDGSADVLYNLDDLWSSPNIDAIGIDNYMPLADWRDEDHSSQIHGNTPYNLEALKSGIASGEGYEWFYASESDRTNRIQTPITDGQGEPWIYRYKDLHSWWSNPHHNRLNGIRQNTPTSWIPQSKPIWFTELGCPAVDKGANQPNVFFDPKSDQSALPYFSSGGRDDLIQRRYLEAHYEYWKEPSNNPVSQVYQGAMVDWNELTPWAWDARPFPFFPSSLEIWSDGNNWHLGHWLNGRLGGCSLEDLVRTILEDFGYEDVELKLDGIVDGYVIPAQTSARAALEPLLSLFNSQVLEEDGKIKIRSQAYADKIKLDSSLLIQEEDRPKAVSRRKSELELPAEAALSHASVFGDYEETITKSRRLEGASDRQISLQAPVVMPRETALALAETRLRNDWLGHMETSVTLPFSTLYLSAGDRIIFSDNSERLWKVDALDRGLAQEASLQSVLEFPALSSTHASQQNAGIGPTLYGRPQVVLLDLPLLKSSSQNRLITHVAISARPWAGNYAVYSSLETNGFGLRANVKTRSVIATLIKPLNKGPLGLLDRQNRLHVALTEGSFQSISQTALFNGGNVLALQSANGSYEILQFETAKLQGDGNWELSNLLRGQLGTEAEMSAGASVGANVVLLDETLQPIEMNENSTGLPQYWRIGPARDPVSSQKFIQLEQTFSARSRKMLSPVHLKGKKTAFGDFKVNWIRRSRLDADSWDGMDVPLDAVPELYQITILDEHNMPKRETTSAVSEFIYEAAMMNEDFGDTQSPFQIRVAQISSAGLAGSLASITIRPNKH